MNKTKIANRQDKIVELILENGTMKVQDLADYFNVSRETIRRDLIVLNEAGRIQKGFGGAIAKPIYDFETRPVETRMKENEENKIQVCEKAYELIKDSQVIFLDTGSTTVYLAKMLKNSSDHIIVSNSIPVINELIGSKNQLILTGGNIDQNVMSAMGLQTIDFLNSIKIDSAVLGTSGFERHNGPTSNTFDDAQVKKTVIKNSRNNIVITDSSKADYSSLTQYADWTKIDYLITDNNLCNEARENLEQEINVIYA